MALNAGDDLAALRDDLAALRERFPGWLIVTIWAAAASGHGRRALFASRGGVRLAALSAGGLAAKITREQARPPDDGA